MMDDFNPGSHVGPSQGDHDELAEALAQLRATASLRDAAGLNEPPNFRPAQAGPCPELGDWLRLATGETKVDERDAFLAHASVCGTCLSRLRACQQMLSADSSVSETDGLANFAPLTPQWRRRLAAKLARTPHQAMRKSMPSILVWSSLAAAAILLLAFTATVWWQHQNAPEKLLALAYSNARTSELRIPGAAFAPVSDDTHLRGGSTGRESAPLLNARAQIESKLEKNPNDAHWLQLQARSQIVEENYDAAIDILDRLIAAGPVTPALLADGGSAYFLRGTATSNENDRATALDYLRRADEMAPNDPVILFNEALVMEDRGQVMNAVETWNRFLKFEQDPKWLEEGQQRLNALEAKAARLKTHESRMEHYFATPQAMKALAANPEGLARIDEELSTTLLPRLLDAAFPMPVDRSRGSPCDEKCLAARSLLRALASSLEAHHQDPWLTDFLPADSSPADGIFSQAARALAVSIDANTRSNYSDALQASLKSRSLFERLGNSAGASRAEVDRMYALERTGVFSACHDAATALLPRVSGYPWISGEALSVDASCNMTRGSAATDNPRDCLARAITE